MILLSGKPQSTNHVYKHRVIGKFASVYMTNEGRAAKEKIKWEMKSQWKKDVSLLPLKVSINYFFGDKRKHDLDNYLKILLDAGTGILWGDDNQIQILNLSKEYDKENPRVSLIVEEL